MESRALRVPGWLNKRKLTKPTESLRDLVSVTFPVGYYVSHGSLSLEALINAVCQVIDYRGATVTDWVEEQHVFRINPGRHNFSGARPVSVVSERSGRRRPGGCGDRFLAADRASAILAVMQQQLGSVGYVGV
jgi:hypothetical protein